MSAHGDHDMGHTVAGWTGSAIAVLGFITMGVALVLASPSGLWAGGLLAALGAVTSWLLHLAGWGKPTGPRPPHRQHWRTRDPDARHGHPDCLGCRLAGRRSTVRPQAETVRAEQGVVADAEKKGRPVRAVG